jgi:hypothetical protein
MPQKIDALMEDIRQLENQLEEEFEARRAAFKYHLYKKKVVFEDGIRRKHEALKTRLWTYVRHARPMSVLTAPAIYAMIIPFVLLDLFVTVYQAICFPVYGIPKVQRRDYFVIDRIRLEYLNALEKFNCAYCSYANGLLAYTVEIASRTEQYWCPIKHSRRMKGSHRRYPEFVDYGDAQTYRDQLRELRAALRGGDPRQKAAQRRAQDKK